MNPNDHIRDQILRYFYDRNNSAKSRFGKRGSAAKISEVKADLKAHCGLMQQQVMSNLTYLTDRHWINTFDVQKTVRVRGGTVPSTVTWYEISAEGIDRIEGDSDFKIQDKYPGINVKAEGNNVITLGDGNVVHVRFAALHEQLEDLKKAISKSQELLDEAKLDIAVDIESLKDQLAKKEPDQTIVRHLWSSIEKAVTAAGFLDYATRIAPAIAQIVS